MSRPDVDMAIDWAAREGWNPGLQDADCYLQADPRGFLLGLLDGEPVASISVMRYSDGFGFLGFYIVRPEYRGRGYGIRIWDAGLRYLKGCNVGLDGVVAQQDNYRKSGFALAYRNIRYQGVGGCPAPADPGITDLSALPFARLAKYDRPFFAAQRSAFLRCWIRQPGCHALGLIDRGELAGYGVIRPCRSGYKIGPLFADSPAQAQLLFQALASRVGPTDSIYLDTPEVNREAVALAGRHGMQVSFETARMYTGDSPELPLERTFGVTSFEVG
ncbi:N-acetyltransferase GCN5 [Marinobacterium nitratireducens]|uniref:N-acetyltransferase GCN5 n=2 Tax=Marinobacterium nitratireducens TaxID=518897 RepID=A0A918DWE3_9GAMM|nr:N-acetyltransferase GCN5 [Marinobacterium nitratireducens]